MIIRISITKFTIIVRAPIKNKTATHGFKNINQNTQPLGVVNQINLEIMVIRLLTNKTNMAN